MFAAGSGINDGSGLPEQHAFGLLRHCRLRIDLLRERISPGRRRPRTDRLKPPLQMREVVEVLTLAGVWHDPRIRGYVGNGIVAGKEFAVREPFIQRRVQPVVVQ